MNAVAARADCACILEFHFDIFWSASNGWQNDTGDAFSDGPVWNGDDWTHLLDDQLDTYLQRDSELSDALDALNTNLPPSRNDIELHYVLSWSHDSGWCLTDVEPSGSGCLFDGESWTKVTSRWEEQDQANLDTLNALLDQFNGHS